MLEALIQKWGFWVILLGSMLEGEGTALSAGALTHRGLLPLPEAALGVFLGTVFGSQLWFWIGFHAGHTRAANSAKLQRYAGRIERFLTRHGDLFVFALRFLYGLRTPSLLWLGSRRFSFWRFVVLDTLGGLLWTVVVLAVGRGLGAALKALLSRSAHAWELMLLAFLLALMAWCVARIRHRVARTA